MANRIKVAVIEGDYADLCGLDLPLALGLQLQLQDLKLSGALWSAKASASGFSVILYWPTTRCHAANIRCCFFLPTLRGVPHTLAVGTNALNVHAGNMYTLN